ILTLLACLLIVAVMVGSFYSTYAPIFREEDKLTHFINPTNYSNAVGKYAKQRLAGVQADRLDHQVFLDHQALLG
ncbi:phosphoethanolamine transferase domain-containing protein, partial [Pseudomonas aeruginosa]